MITPGFHHIFGKLILRVISASTQQDGRVSPEACERARNEPIQICRERRQRLRRILRLDDTGKIGARQQELARTCSTQSVSLAELPLPPWLATIIVERGADRIGTECSTRTI